MICFLFWNSHVVRTSVLTNFNSEDIVIVGRDSLPFSNAEVHYSDSSNSMEELPEPFFNGENNQKSLAPDHSTIENTGSSLNEKDIKYSNNDASTTNYDSIEIPNVTDGHQLSSNTIEQDDTAVNHVPLEPAASDDPIPLSISKHDSTVLNPMSKEVIRTSPESIKNKSGQPTELTNSSEDEHLSASDPFDNAGYKGQSGSYSVISSSQSPKLHTAQLEPPSTSSFIVETGLTWIFLGLPQSEYTYILAISSDGGKSFTEHQTTSNFFNITVSSASVYVVRVRCFNPSTKDKSVFSQPLIVQTPSPPDLEFIQSSVWKCYTLTVLLGLGLILLLNRILESAHRRRRLASRQYIVSVPLTPLDCPEDVENCYH
ncbi:hypothetical protein RCL1_008410 [Eukaryota sp. TZLM3-RCL]